MSISCMIEAGRQARFSLKKLAAQFSSTLASHEIFRRRQQHFVIPYLTCFTHFNIQNVKILHCG